MRALKIGDRILIAGIDCDYECEVSKIIKPKSINGFSPNILIVDEGGEG